jgi:hypothetical protein
VLIFRVWIWSVCAEESEFGMGVGHPESGVEFTVGGVGVPVVSMVAPTVTD